MPCRRVMLDRPPYGEADGTRSWQKRGIWPCRWVACAGANTPPFVTAYRLRFGLSRRAKIRAHVSADERYELFLDGERVGRGSERGDRENWFFETYDFDLQAGRHVIVARVWSLGDKAPYAQMSVRPGFLFSPEGEYTRILGTGVAGWEAKRLGGYAFASPLYAWGTGVNVKIDGAEFPWRCESGGGPGWKPAVPQSPGTTAGLCNDSEPFHLLRPAVLPPQLDRDRPAGRARFAGPGRESSDPEAARIRPADSLQSEISKWNALLERGRPLLVPARSRRRVLIDIGDYCCAYPELTVSGGKSGSVKISWAEALYAAPEDPKGWPPARPKGNRDEIEGKYFSGVGDIFLPDGGRRRKFSTLWWQAGRFIQIDVRTAARPLRIENFRLRETRYPLEMESSFIADDRRLADFMPLGIRSLQMCSHETYMDCPYYEQLMYVGDTRLEALTTYVAARDDRLPRKALAIFDSSRLTAGLTQSRYPSRVRQIIPPFSLWWVGMVYDYALWRQDLGFVRSLMPGVRSVLEHFLNLRGRQGLIAAPKGWNYVDWVPQWRDGIPPGTDRDPSGPINWQCVLALGMAASLENWLGETELSRRMDRLAEELAGNALAAFWSKERELLADNLKRDSFSEHTQCLALLSRRVQGQRRAAIARGLLLDPSLARTTIYFSHYLFEAYRLLGATDPMFRRLEMWLGLREKGFRTTLESPEPSRSDCHAWGAHPIYHFFATILGIRPAAPGFTKVSIAPQLGPLARASGRLVHPKGFIKAEFHRKGRALRGEVTLPRGVSGTFSHGGSTVRLREGTQRLQD